MSDGKSDSSKESEGKVRPARPSHIAYQVREGKEGDAYFNRVGAAFPHKDKQGFDVQLDSVPVNGRVTLRSMKDRLDAQRSGQGSGGRDGRDQERGE